MDSVAAVVVVPAESAIAGRRLTLIEQAKGCHESMAPFFCLFSSDTSAEEASIEPIEGEAFNSGGTKSLAVPN